MHHTNMCQGKVCCHLQTCTTCHAHLRRCCVAEQLVGGDLVLGLNSAAHDLLQAAGHYGHCSNDQTQRRGANIIHGPVDRQDIQQQEEGGVCVLAG